MIKKIFFPIFILFLFFTFLAERPVRAASNEVLTLAAASSFSFALKEMVDNFSRSTHSEVRLIFGSSGVLARQIERGAPFDVFISANSAYMDGLAKSGAVRADSVRAFAGGAIVIALSTASGLEIRDLSGLSGKDVKRIAIANPLHAPYGRAAVEALKSAGIWEGVRKKLVYGENVRQTLQFVESGNVDAAIIALSVARREGIRVVPIEAALHGVIVQKAAVVSGTPHRKAAEKFMRYLTGAEGMLVLEKYGFSGP